jgi:hypothetical protein
MKPNVPPSYDPLEKQKLIISAPAGLHGFYLFGVSAFIKENYNLTNISFPVHLPDHGIHYSCLLREMIVSLLNAY